MKNRITAIALTLVLLLCGSGCALLETEYSYSEPYVGTLERDTGDATEVRNYSMLKAAILDMINNRQESAEFRFSNYNGTVSNDLAAVCLEITSVNPLGAYAVETLDFDTSRIISYYIAEVQITYKKSAEQIRNIHSVNSSAELKAYLHDEILLPSLPITTIRSYGPQLDAPSFEKLLEQLCLEDPAGIPLPVYGEIEGYPDEGSNRIYEISLRYELTEPRRRAMSDALNSRVGELLAQPLPQESAARALALAQMVSEGLTEQTGSYGNTAYGALIEHSADSRGIALAYSALCNASDIPCMVVKGGIGTMGTEEHYWNIIALGGDYYHVDVSQFIFDPAYAFLVSDDSLWGTYIWDTDDYPACGGLLRYADVVPETDGAGSADETEAPEKSEPEEEPEPADPSEENTP